MEYDTLGYIHDNKQASYQIRQNVIAEIAGRRPPSGFPEQPENVRAWELWREYEALLAVDKFARAFENWLERGAPLDKENDNGN